METIEQRRQREEREKVAKNQHRQEIKNKRFETDVALQTGSANQFIAENNVKQKASSGASASDKNFSRRVLREVKRYEATGRVSNWLANEFTKAQALRQSTAKESQQQPETLPTTSTSSPIPIVNAPADSGYKPIEIPPKSDVFDFLFKIETRIIPDTDPIEYKIVVNSGEGKSLGTGSDEFSTPETEITDKSNFVIYVKADFGAGVYTIEHDTLIPSNADNIAYYPIGSVTYSDGSYSITQRHIGILYYTYAEETGQILYWDEATARWKSTQTPEPNSIFVFGENEWTVVAPPSGEGTHVLGYTGNGIEWLPTTSCEEELA
jgi:hypothetical protein